ncbi:sugar ABC transporter substrate-binding protein [Nocardioides mesophilus]|uniref:Sugar ABC transporter substrate-binding protein n=1 Tax=Nocardioides mesophilus TaxID=433659 RepID=A0A7G9RDT7_9ACTN|nr:sugar ABC transporter substrate-binding protein [Nocardioides mesophilus]QNN53762.1 sugar ABC transporter substrate-binding protein [Nocardioides mesophilus]
MRIRRALTLGLAAGALVLAGCSTGEDSSSNAGGNESSSGGGGGDSAVSAQDIRIDVVTHAAPGDSFWDVVKAGADRAGKDLGVDVRYNSSPDPGEQSTLIDNAVADGTDGLVVSMANPDGLETSIKNAVQAGIPVITINSGIDQWKAFGAITHVGQSESIAGEAAGQQLKEAGATNAICVIHEAGNIGLEERCKAAADAFGGTMKNLQVDSTDLAGAQATIESQLSADSSIDAILTLNGDIAGRAVAAVDSSGRDVQIGTFDLNADVAKLVKDGKLLFAVDQQPYVQGYLGVTGIYLKLINGNDIGGGQPVYSGPAIVTQDNAGDVLKFAENGTR